MKEIVVEGIHGKSVVQVDDDIYEELKKENRRVQRRKGTALYFSVYLCVKHRYEGEKLNHRPYGFSFRKLPDIDKDGNINNSKYVYIHRYIMFKEVIEKMMATGLGWKDIHVHHKDENPLNNQRSNLVVVTAEEHDAIHNGLPKAN